MDKHKIDFLREWGEEAGRAFEKAREPKNIREALKHAAGIGLALVLMLVLAYSARAVISGKNLFEQFGQTSIFSQLKHLVGSEEKLIRGEERDRINILLLGIGGANHEGGQLTDTIMVASLKPSEKAVGLLSIPRDLVTPIPGAGWQKINTANAIDGPALARATVENITGLPLDYYLLLDFSGFKKMIDALGGIKVSVREAFTDNQYPDYNYGYQPVHFDAGEQVLDGERALQYARSRHGSGGEGSDFARARRQQEILRALQSRLLDLSTLLNPNKLLALSDIVGSHLTTDMEIWESLRLVNLVKEIKPNKISQTVLASGPEGLLTAEIGEDGAYLLRPRLGAGDFSEIKLAAQNLLNPPDFRADKPDVVKKIRLAVQNGTYYPGLANRWAETLSRRSYQITVVGNAPRRDYQKTVIYNLSGADENGAAIQSLREELKANVAPALPRFLHKPAADVLIIVGEDNASKDSLSFVPGKEID